jgi:hypothetical protein
MAIGMMITCVPPPALAVDVSAVRAAVPLLTRYGEIRRSVSTDETLK